MTDVTDGSAELQRGRIEREGIMPAEVKRVPDIRILAYVFMATLGLVAIARPDEPKPATPVLTLPGRVVVKTEGKEVGELRGPTSAVAYSQDGKLLASVASNPGGLVKQAYLPSTTNQLPSASSTIKLWDARSGQELRVELHRFEVVASAFSPDGTQLVCACSKDVDPGHPIPPDNIKVWEVASGKELLSLKGHEQRIECLAISPSGKRLAAAGTRTKVWDAATGKELFTFGGLSGEALCLGFSFDDKRLAVGTRNFADQEKAAGIRGEARFFDLTTGEQLAMWKPHGQYVKTLAYSPDGKQLALGVLSPGVGVKKESPVKVCDAEAGRELLGLPDQSEVSRLAQRLAFSPDSRHLAVILSEQGKTAVKVWEATTAKLLKTLPVGDALCVAFAPDGARLAVGGRQGVTVWEIRP
jgi:WD40 repeat protein